MFICQTKIAFLRSENLLGNEAENKVKLTLENQKILMLFMLNNQFTVMHLL